MVVVDLLTLELIVFSGVIIGGFGRMMLPYLQKLKEAENQGTNPPGFQKKYIFTMIYSFALSLVAAMTLFPSISANIPADAQAAAVPGIFFTTVLAGWGANSLVNNITTMATGQKKTA